MKLFVLLISVALAVGETNPKPGQQQQQNQQQQGQKPSDKGSKSAAQHRYSSICSYTATTKANSEKRLVNKACDELDKSTYMSFSVKACEGAYILLSDMPQNYSSQQQQQSGKDEEHHEECSKFWIKIGDQAGKRSSIRDPRNNKELTSSAHPEQEKPLSCNKYHRFYINWRNNRIEVGYEHPHEDKDQHVALQAFLRYAPDKPMKPFKYIYAASKSDAEWQFDAPCPKKSATQTHTRTITYTQESFQKKKYITRRVDVKSQELVQVIPPPGTSVSDMRRFCMSIKMCGSARLVLAQNASEPKKNVLEITIGGENSQKTELVYIQEEGKQAAQLQKSEQPLKCNEFRKFYVQWKDNQIEFGKEVISDKNPRYLEDVPYFTKKMDSAMAPINAILVASANKDEQGTFLIDFKQQQSLMMYWEETREIKSRIVRKTFPLQQLRQLNRCVSGADDQEKNNSKCYLMSEDKMNFQQAKDYCQRVGGQVALFSLMSDNHEPTQALQQIQPTPRQAEVREIKTKGDHLQKVPGFSMKKNGYTLSFAVKMSDGALIVFSPSPNDTRQETLNVVIGGKNNRRQVTLWRRSKPGQHQVLIQTQLQKPLTNEPRAFWIRFQKGGEEVIIGEGWTVGQNIVLRYSMDKDVDYQQQQPIKPEYVFLGSPAGESGTFYVKRWWDERKNDQMSLEQQAWQQQSQYELQSQPQQQQQQSRSAEWWVRQLETQYTSEQLQNQWVPAPSSSQDQQQSPMYSNDQGNSTSSQQQQQQADSQMFWAIEGVPSGGWHDRTKSSYTVQCTASEDMDSSRDEEQCLAVSYDPSQSSSSEQPQQQQQDQQQTQDEQQRQQQQSQQQQQQQSQQQRMSSQQDQQMQQEQQRQQMQQQQLQQRQDKYAQKLQFQSRPCKQQRRVLCEVPNALKYQAHQAQQDN